MLIVSSPSLFSLEPGLCVEEEVEEEGGSKHGGEEVENWLYICGL
jgi:hypothetical protein